MDRTSAIALAEAVKAGVGQSADVHVVLCPPSVFLLAVDQVLEGHSDRAGRPEHERAAERSVHGRSFGRNAR